MERGCSAAVGREITWAGSLIFMKKRAGINKRIKEQRIVEKQLREKLEKRKVAIIFIVAQAAVLVVAAFVFVLYIYPKYPLLGMAISMPRVVGGEYVYDGRVDDIPYMETRNSALNAYLAYANMTIDAWVSHYAYYFGEDLTLRIQPRRQGLFGYTFALTGSRSDGNGVMWSIDDIIEVDFRGIYSGREATVTINGWRVGEMDL
jgi:hypothetical protein